MEGKGVNAPDPGPLIGIPSTGRGLDVGKTAVRRYSGGLVGHTLSTRPPTLSYLFCRVLERAGFFFALR